ncbi:hypothetical protein M5E06_24400 [Azospirillum sp. A1-3]|uniref:hypothetical protein n=1 Tax=Azospirillum sp. A1-3 TaxID=185874 RepID=UPI0020772B05|nr:hypothetical protein [Azospirillum sp. A1-3]MCM8737265.1 hypothetical protein [Azospirillum sp. A1-3]
MMARKAKRTAKGDNYDAQLATWIKEFEPVQKAAADSEKADEGARKALYAALEGLFDFGRRLLESGDFTIAQAFVDKMGGKWGAVAQKNPFTALVKIAFKHASDAPQSKYAKVLQVAYVLKIKDPLSKWLLSGGKTLEIWYEEADQHLSPESAASKDAKTEALIADGIAALKKEKPLSGVVQLSAPLSSSSEFATVLVRVVGPDQIEIVKMLSTEEADVAPILKKHGSKKRSARSTLEQHSLFRFFRAVEFITSVSTPPGAKERRLIVVETSEDAGAITSRLYSAASMYDFMYAEARITGHDLGLPVGSSLYFDVEKSDTAEQFVSGFLKDSNWSVEVHGNGSCTLVPENTKLNRITLLPFTEKEREGLFVGTSKFTSSAKTAFDYGAAQHALDWLDAMKEFVSSSNQTRVAKTDTDSVLKLKDGQGAIAAAAIRAPSATPVDLFPVPASYKLPKDRHLRVRDIQRLADMAVAYGLSMSGDVVDAEVKSAFAVLEQKLNEDELRCFVPFATNQQGTYARCCQSIDE